MPPVVERPLTEAELVAVVAQAAAAGRPVAVAGIGGGRADAVTVALSGYHRLLSVDRDGGQATVEAGISLGWLGVTLGSWGLSLENGGRDPAQALGAAVSLGAHGTGAGYGGVATQVTALRLVTPEGTIVTCSAREEPEIFAAARVGLGALGVISTVTVRCQLGFNLRTRTQTVDLDQALADFGAVAATHDHVEWSWRPGGRTARVTTADRTDEPADGRAVDRGYRWFNRRRTHDRQPVEVAVAGPDSGPALQRARELGAACRRGIARFPIVVSVTAGDDLPLSPAEGRPSVYIAGLAGLEGRPQWRPGPRPRPEDMAPLYPRLAEWQAVRDRLDPDRRFAHSSGQG